MGLRDRRLSKSIYPWFVILISITCCKHDSPEPERAAEDIKQDVAFIHVNLLPLDEERVVEDQTVLVHGGVITKIGGSISVPDGYFVIDGSNQYLMPGLADMHTHVYYQEDLLPYIANGVTTILNMGSSSAVLEFRRMAASQEIISPTLFASAFVDGAGNRGWVMTSPAEAATDVAQIKSMGWDFIKVYNSLKKDVFTSIQTEAAKNNIPIIGHGVREPGMEYVLTHGQVMVAHMEEYLYTHFGNTLNSALVPSAVSITKSAGAYVTPNLSAYEAIALQWGNPGGLNTLNQQAGIKYVSPKWKDFWKGLGYTSNAGSLQAQYNFLKTLTKKFSEGGVPLLLGTDSPYIPGLPNGFSIHDDLRNLVEAGLTPFEAIRAGTKTPGEFINRFLTGTVPFGLIKEGYRADMILLKGNPLKDVANIKGRVGVMANGRWMSEKFLQSKMAEIAN